MNDTYLVVNGVKVQLTEEQRKCLGLSSENPFEEPDLNDRYYYVTAENDVGSAWYARDAVDYKRIDVANCFKNQSFAKKVANAQLLYRRLLKFSFDNDAADKPWDGYNYHFFIRYEYDVEAEESGWDVSATCMNRCLNEVYFSKEAVARRALEEVVEPFLEEFNIVNGDMESL